MQGLQLFPQALHLFMHLVESGVRPLLLLQKLAGGIRQANLRGFAGGIAFQQALAAFAIPLRLLLPLFFLGPALFQLHPYAFQPLVDAQAGAGGLQALKVLSLLPEPGCHGHLFFFVLLPAVVQLFEFPLQCPDSVVGKVEGDFFQYCFQRFDFSANAIQLARLLHQRLQEFALLAGALHRLVGLGEVAVAAYQLVYLALNVGLPQHLLPYEVRQVANRFHGDGLVKKVEGFGLPDAEGLPKAVGIIGKSVEHVRVRALAQAFLQAFDLVAEVAEVVYDAHFIMGQHIELPHAVVLQPEYLRQRDGLPVAFIGKNGQQHREVFFAGAQVHVPGFARLRNLFVFVSATDVTQQAAFAGFRPGGFVVGDLLVRHQQGGDGVDEGGLAGADIAGQQSVVSIGVDGPDVLIEGAPVEHFQLMQAVAGAFVVDIGIQFEYHHLLF